MLKFTVTADHVSPRFCFVDKAVMAKPAPGREGFWYATADDLGCSKDYSSPERAVRSLFDDNACTHVRITAVS